MRIIFIVIAAVAAVVLAGFTGVYFLSEARFRDVKADAPFDAPIPDDMASIERGRHIARTRGCFGCHGQQLQGYDFGEQWDWPERAVAPNLAQYAKDHDVATLEAAIRQGIGAKGKALISMPSFNFARLSDDDLVALIAFLRSAPIVEADLPKPKLGWGVRWSFVMGEEKHIAYWADLVPQLRVDAASEPARARGEYLAMTMCNECHGFDVRGSTLWGFVTPDLAMVAAYSRESFEQLITTGTSMAGKELGLMSLVAPDRFPELTQQEIDDLYLYLTSLVDEAPAENVAWRP